MSSLIDAEKPFSMFDDEDDDLDWLSDDSYSYSDDDEDEDY